MATPKQPKPYRAPREAVELYIKLKELRATVETLHEARRLPGFHEGSLRLNHAMGLSDFWQTEIMFCDDPNPPAYMRSNRWAVEGWQKGWNARCELEKAIRDLIISTDLSS
jgi:hypothetical protein